jgi:preprotein translocase subunit SecG
MAPFFIGLLSVLLGIVSVLIVFIVLMQRPKQEGLGAAFGGGMTDQMFGAQTTNVLQKGTVYLAVMFFVFSMILSVLTAKSVRSDSDTIDAMKAAPVPAPIEEVPGLGETFPGGATTAPVQIPTTPLGTEPAGDATAPADATPAAVEDAVEEAVETIEEAVEEVPAVIEEAATEVPAVIEENKPGE